ncbi:glycosyl hydrolase family 18 protein [Streptomyces sp. SL13]|jgi:chitinase|uniref:Glycosyl hydrolase family 18 protein n=1 Tax=Streptantibioticus silvisoli TaxID=2705255 RepID=A0AA90H739_9ACTN|nr:glycosyl hydrolase family 18 protein [Streptantibioticus silvisoli]MDI5973146.1 glycosyl hydrolase family 18 protein [Streptantibioticus silvisoli]
MTKNLARTCLAAVVAATPALLLMGTAGQAQAADSFPSQYAAPYLQLGSDTVGDMAADQSATGLNYYTLAFLTSSSGCTLQWEDGGDPVGAYTSQINDLKSSGGSVIISFGGAGSTELAQSCTSVSDLTAAYQNVVSTYGVNRLDFDIEGGAMDDTASNQRRDQALAALQQADPSVQIDFTVPVAPSGLESDAQQMLSDAKSAGVNVNLVNIMTMDFGDGENALNDAESGANATASQLADIYGGSAADNWARMGLTPIAGQNDDDENFSQSDASTLESFAASKGVQELSFWEVDEYDKAVGYAYSKIFNQI